MCDWEGLSGPVRWGEGQVGTCMEPVRRVLSGCVGPVAGRCDRSGLVRLGAEEEEGADVMIVCFGFLFVILVDGFL